MVRAVLAATVLALAATACQAPPGNAGAEDPLPVEPVAITTASGAVRSFRVEVADTPAEQAQGLMFRTSLTADGGMLFPTDPPRIMSFWMKDTMIPLDVIFVRADGTIARIVENAAPQSLVPVDAGEPVVAMLEIAGGRAAALGIAQGDRVVLPPAR